MTVSNQQIYGLSFAAVCCTLFGGAIAACGLLFQYHDDYNGERVNGMAYNQYYYTQYWLGAPLIVLGVVILSFLCCKARPILYVSIVLSCLTLALAIAAVVLEGPKWIEWLQLRKAALDNNEKESNGVCLDDPTSLAPGPSRTGLSCKEILYATLMQSILTACSIVSIIVSQFVVFFSIRVMDRMSKGTYNMAPKEQHNNFYNSHSSNVHIMSEM